MSGDLTFIDKLLGKKESKNYRKFIIVPPLLLLLSVGILVGHFYQTGEWFDRSIDLKGGTLITVNTYNDVNIQTLEDTLSERFGDVSVRKTKGISTPSIIVEVSEDVNANDVLSEMESYGIDTSINSVQMMGSSLGESFWQQAQMGVLIAFIAMGIIVFLIFRSKVPSLLVISAAVADILTATAFMQVFGIQFSLPSIAALLMLIGYSVDTDIMLTTRLMRDSDEPFMSRFRRAFKTGLTETFTSIAAVSALVISNISPVLTQIAAVLLLGLVADIIYTWTMNSVLLRWHMENRGLI
ncbi:MAG: protein translocase subunit SecF [Candidatus Micrarchaeota archaeon]|nr:protein translocase subunit SecF [Candidatus Micrarchaeota archaeon]